MLALRAANAPVVCGKRVGGLEVAGATCAGTASKLNEDRLRIFSKGFCVIDGMGSGCDGEVFAELAANRVQSLLERGSGASRALAEADRSLAGLRRWVLGNRGGAMGCACSFGDGGGVAVACLGDVRAFLVGREVREVFCPASISVRGGYLGTGDACAFRERMLVRQELLSHVLLVCSDGFWRFVGVKDLTRTIWSSPSLEHVACELVRLAQSCASSDDITIALCRPLAES